MKKRQSGQLCITVTSSCCTVGSGHVVTVQFLIKLTVMLARLHSLILMASLEHVRDDQTRNTLMLHALSRMWAVLVEGEWSYPQILG